MRNHLPLKINGSPRCFPNLGEAQLGKPSNPSSSTHKKLLNFQSSPSPSEQQQRPPQTPTFPWRCLKLHPLNPQSLKRSMSRAELFAIRTCGQALLPCSLQGHRFPFRGGSEGHGEIWGDICSTVPLPVSNGSIRIIFIVCAAGRQKGVSWPSNPSYFIFNCFQSP